MNVWMFGFAFLDVWMVGIVDVWNSPASLPGRGNVKGISSGWDADGPPFGPWRPFGPPNSYRGQGRSTQLGNKAWIHIRMQNHVCRPTAWRPSRLAGLLAGPLKVGHWPPPLRNWTEKKNRGSKNQETQPTLPKFMLK